MTFSKVHQKYSHYSPNIRIFARIVKIMYSHLRIAGLRVTHFRSIAALISIHSLRYVSPLTPGDTAILRTARLNLTSCRIIASIFVLGTGVFLSNVSALYLVLLNTNVPSNVELCWPRHTTRYIDMPLTRRVPSWHYDSVPALSLWHEAAIRPALPVRLLRRSEPTSSLPMESNGLYTEWSL